MAMSKRLQEIDKEIDRKKEKGEKLGVMERITDFSKSLDERACKSHEKAEAALRKQTLLIRMKKHPEQSLTEEEVAFLRACKEEEDKKQEENQGSFLGKITSYLKEQHEKSWGKDLYSLEKTIERAEEIGITKTPRKPAPEPVQASAPQSAPESVSGDCEVRTPSGTTKVENLKTGDSVIDSEGNAQKIVATHQCEKKESPKGATTETPEEGEESGKEPFIHVFIMGGSTFASATVVLLFAALFTLIPIINLLAFPVAFIALCVMIFVAPAMILRDLLRWCTGTKIVLSEKEENEMIIESGVKKRMIQERIRERNAKAEAELQKCQASIEERFRARTGAGTKPPTSPVETEEEKEVAKEEEINPEKMKVDLGAGKKVPFKDLPASLQQQLLEEYRKEKE